MAPYTAVQVLPVRPDDDICDMAFGGNLAYLVRNVNNNFKAASAAKNIGREILYVDVLAPCESYVLLLIVTVRGTHLLARAES